MEASTDSPNAGVERRPATDAQVRSGEGWSAAHLDELGDGPGFRKVRTALGVGAFGVNAIVLPPGIETGFHFHDEQEELYFVHSGAIEMEFGDGATEIVSAGGFARVDAPTPRKIRNAGNTDAVYVIVGAKGGYVGRDGRVPEGEEERVRALHDLRGGGAS
jgi:mannose-6-phosphate isomerase-like protein (cupin superfamily)